MRNIHPKSHSRRQFLTKAAVAGGAVLLSPSWLQAAEDVDLRAARVLSRTIGVDMHNHVYPAGTEPQPQNGQTPQGPALLIAEELKRSGFTAVCASFVLDFASSKRSPIPVNILADASTSLQMLADNGVARVSYGAAPYVEAINALEQAAGAITSWATGG